MTSVTSVVKKVPVSDSTWFSTTTTFYPQLITTEGTEDTEDGTEDFFIILILSSIPSVSSVPSVVRECVRRKTVVVVLGYVITMLRIFATSNRLSSKKRE